MTDATVDAARRWFREKCPGGEGHEGNDYPEVGWWKGDCYECVVQALALARDEGRRDGIDALAETIRHRAEREALATALRAAAKSLEWIANRKASSDEARTTLDVLSEIRQYADGRARAARAALAPSSPVGAAASPVGKED